MSGRRLLDAVAVFKTSRAIAAKHIAFRQHQLNDYNKTSSLTKAVKFQTDRITLTVKAASALAERFNEPERGDAAQPRKSEQSGPGRGREGESGPAQSNNGVESARPHEEVVDSSKNERNLSYDIDRTSGKVDDIQDQYPRSKSAGLSTSEDVVPPVVIGDIDPKLKQEQKEEQAELPEEAYPGIFQSRKVSRMLQGELLVIPSSRDLGSPRAATVPTQSSNTQVETDDVIRSTQFPKKDFDAGSDLAGNSKRESSGNPEDVQQLASDTAKETHAMGKESASPSTEHGNVTNRPSYEMRESKVPSSRIGRIWQYGGLATSMALGAVGESFRRATGAAGEPGGSLMLSEANMERLVAKLSKMRGAALKLGQMMSFQDSKMLPKPINDVLQRVQDSADYMPPSQRNQVLSSNLGSNWRNLFSTFDENPIAAASIGQVHRATLASTSQPVAVKVQYPGVSSSIDSDLSNLAILLTASRLLPKGLYLDKTIANARVELAWECDYIREAEMGRRFRELLADQADIYHVPTVIKEASGPQVLTAEYVEGTGVTKGQNFTQNQKDWIGSNVLRLCLREITEFKFMQTDPNWTNFLFNPKSHKLELLDFGASRDFPDKFILPYIRTLLAASRGDRQQVRDLSIELGYLTGHESKAMVDAHVSSVLTLAEPFAETAPEVYDFRDQTITDRVRGFIPVMLKERLAPPPEETYSIHRKLSGAFLLCARLGSRVRCREMFEQAMKTSGML